MKTEVCDKLFNSIWWIFLKYLGLIHLFFPKYFVYIFLTPVHFKQKNLRLRFSVPNCSKQNSIKSITQNQKWTSGLFLPSALQNVTACQSWNMIPNLIKSIKSSGGYGLVKTGFQKFLGVFNLHYKTIFLSNIDILWSKKKGKSVLIIPECYFFMLTLLTNWINFRLKCYAPRN